MNKPENHIDRLFKEKLSSTEAENPSGADAWARMNAMLQAGATSTTIQEKEEKPGGLVVWFRQYSMAVAAAVLVALTGVAGLVILQKNNTTDTAIALADTEGNGKNETVIPTKESKTTATETKAGNAANNSAAPTNTNPSINGVLPQNIQPASPKPAQKEKKPSLRKQYPDIARMQTLVAMNGNADNNATTSEKEASVNSTMQTASLSTKEADIALTSKSLEVLPSSEFVMVPVQILYKGSLPTAEQLAAYKAEERGEKVGPNKGAVRNFFASLWRFKKGEGSTTDVKENTKGLYAVFSSSEEE
jgi:hypothetical protein